MNAVSDIDMGWLAEMTPERWYRKSGSERGPDRIMHAATMSMDVKNKLL